MTKIGVLESGIGGLTTLCEIVKAVGGGEYLYFADNLNAPYGNKTEAEIKAAVTAAVSALLHNGAELIVLACNTATAAAALDLRGALSVPVVGIEPAVRPALAAGGRTLVLATPYTVKSEKFARLTDGCDVTAVPCEGLADKIEAAAPGFDGIKEEFGRIIGDKSYDNVVLGCTHYCYLKGAIRNLLPAARIFDGNAGVARRTADLAGRRSGRAEVTFLFSGGAKEKLYKELFLGLLY